MDNQFINCPNCGTRNFIDDKVCGICKMDLDKNFIQTLPVKKNNYFILILIFAGLLLFYFNLFKKEKASANYESRIDSTNPQVTDAYHSILPQYKLLKISLNNKCAFNVDVRINSKLSEDDLKLMAQKIKKEINAISEKGVIYFLLPEMKIDNSAWAAIDFNPELNVRIIGQSIA